MINEEWFYVDKAIQNMSVTYGFKLSFASGSHTDSRVTTLVVYDLNNQCMVNVTLVSRAGINIRPPNERET